MVYKVKAGDSLWKIAEDLYGDGSYYDRLILPKESGDEAVIQGEAAVLQTDGKKKVLPVFLIQNDRMGVQFHCSLHKAGTYGVPSAVSHRKAQN